MAAVLEEGVACLSVDPSCCSGRRRREFYAAKKWLNAPNNEDWVFSFVNVCEALGLDPNYLRRGLNRWVANHGAKLRVAPRLPADGAGVRYKHCRLRA